MDPLTVYDGTGPTIVGPPAPDRRSRVLQDGRHVLERWSPGGGVRPAGWPGGNVFVPPGRASDRAPLRRRLGAEGRCGRRSYPIRLPALPDGWQATPGTRSGIDAGRTDPRTGDKQRGGHQVGYIAPSKMYVS